MTADLYTPTDDDADPMAAPRAMDAARRRRSLDEDWIGDEFARIERELVALRAMKRGKGQPKVYLQSPVEVLKAFELGVLNKAEARAIMGLKRTRQPAQLRTTRRAK